MVVQDGRRRRARLPSAESSHTRSKKTNTSSTPTNDAAPTSAQRAAIVARSPAETAEAVRVGRLHTGDVGFIDQDGYA
jgi:hypothetical protein